LKNVSSRELPACASAIASTTPYDSEQIGEKERNLPNGDIGWSHLVNSTIPDEFDIVSLVPHGTGRPSLAEMSFDSFRIPVYEGSSRLGTAEDLDLNILDLNMTPYPRVIHQPRYPTAVLLSPGWPSSLPDPSVVAKLSVCQSVLSLI
jgi:hypothetical protein